MHAFILLHYKNNLHNTSYLENSILFILLYRHNTSVDLFFYLYNKPGLQFSTENFDEFAGQSANSTTR